MNGTSNFCYTVGDTELIVLNNLAWLKNYLTTIRDVTPTNDTRRHLNQEIDMFIDSIERIAECFKSICRMDLYPDVDKFDKSGRCDRDFYCITYQRRSDGISRLHIEVKREYVLATLLSAITYSQFGIIRPNDAHFTLECAVSMYVNPKQYSKDPIDLVLENLRNKNY